MIQHEQITITLIFYVVVIAIDFYQEHCDLVFMAVNKQSCLPLQV